MSVWKTKQGCDCRIYFAHARLTYKTKFAHLWCFTTTRLYSPPKRLNKTKPVAKKRERNENGIQTKQRKIYPQFRDGYETKDYVSDFTWQRWKKEDTNGRSNKYKINTRLKIVQITAPEYITRQLGQLLRIPLEFRQHVILLPWSRKTNCRLRFHQWQWMMHGCLEQVHSILLLCNWPRRLRLRGCWNLRSCWSQELMTRSNQGHLLSVGR